MGGEELKRILFKGDKVIWIVFFIMCSISWVEVFSATSRQIESGHYWLPIIKHTVFIAAGTVVVWIMHNMKVSWIKGLTYIIYGLGLAGLIWAQIDEGSRINDSARWIKIMGFTFQPMELAKMGLVMVTALITSQHQDENGTDRFALKKILIYSALPILLIFKENFSTAFLILLALYGMMLVSRYPGRQMLMILGTAVVIGAVGASAVMITPDSAAKESSFGRKIVTWKHRVIDAMSQTPVTPEDYEIKNEQRTYANIAIASSHIFGCGPGNSVQRDFLPHAYSDFIYAIIIEELGLVGGVVVLLLYMTILYRCGKIARRCEDPYPAYLVMGIGMIITLQAMMHMYISVGDFVTGQPLPLISQGGTSMLINCVYIGMILSVSRYAKKASANPNKSLDEIENSSINNEKTETA